MGESSPNDQVQALGRYALIEELGEGYLGPVYRGFDQDIGRPVVVRVLCNGIKWDAEVEEVFQSECRAVGALQHPNIASILDVGKEGKTHYIAMESLGSGNLQALIAEKPDMPAEAKLSIMIQIVEGLGHAHKNGVLHLNLAPGKIHVTAEGNVKIRDFAVTHILKKYLPHPIVRWGTPIYLSPEQIQQQDCDGRSDVFSAGMIFYELLTYFHPFHDPNSNKALDNILLDAPIPTFEQFPDVPPGIWGLLKTCMERNPGDRYQSMDELLDACKETQKSLAEDNQLMLAELYASLTPLEAAAARPNASQSTIRLFQDIQKLSRGEIKADYVSLDRMMTRLIDQYSLIQSADGLASSEDPQICKEVSKTVIPAQDELPFFDAPIENQETPLQEQEATTPALSTDSNPGTDPGSEPRMLLVEGATQDSAADPAESHLPTIEDLRSKLRQSQTVSGATPEVKKSPAAASKEEKQKAPRSKTAATSGRLRIARPFHLVAAVMLLLLIVVTAAYIVFRTDVPSQFHRAWDFLLKNSQASANAAVPQPEPENAGTIPPAAETQETTSETDSLGEMDLLTSKESEDGHEVSVSGKPLGRPPRERLQKVGALIDSGKFRLAGIELANLQKAYPGSSDVSALRRRLQTKSVSETQDQVRQESQNTTLQRQKEEEWNRRLAALFARADYQEADRALNLWLREYPGNPRAHEYGTKLEEIQRSQKILNAAISESRYQDALNALNSMEKQNPSDPNLAGMRREIETKKASARASLTVHRLGAKATLLLDGQPIGADGEVRNERIPIGQHTISIENSGGTVAARMQEFPENQQVVLVYDLAKSILRPTSGSDAELLAQRKMKEEIHSFELSHEHGLFRGSCRGVLSLDYHDVAYKPFSGQHGFRIPFKLLKIDKIDGKSVDLSFISDDKHFESFKFQDEQEAEGFAKVWNSLKAISH